MRAFLPTLLLALALVPLVPPSGADAHGDCDSKGTFAFGIITIRSLYVAGDPVAYVDDRNFAMGNGIWVYLESNGEYVPFPQSLLPHDPLADLQRGGYSATMNDPDICWDDSPSGPDMLIF